MISSRFSLPNMPETSASPNQPNDGDLWGVLYNSLHISRCLCARRFWELIEADLVLVRHGGMDTPAIAARRIVNHFRGYMLLACKSGQPLDPIVVGFEALRPTLRVAGRFTNNREMDVSYLVQSDLGQVRESALALGAWQSSSSAIQGRASESEGRM